VSPLDALAEPRYPVAEAAHERAKALQDVTYREVRW
jgi:hypothetical protein